MGAKRAERFHARSCASILLGAGAHVPHVAPHSLPPPGTHGARTVTVALDSCPRKSGTKQPPMTNRSKMGFTGHSMRLIALCFPSHATQSGAPRHVGSISMQNVCQKFRQLKCSSLIASTRCLRYISDLES